MIFQTYCTYNRFFPLNCVYYKTYRGLSAKKVCQENWIGRSAEPPGSFMTLVED